MRGARLLAVHLQCLGLQEVEGDGDKPRNQYPLQSVLGYPIRVQE